MAITFTPVTAANANFGPLGSAAWALGMKVGGLSATSGAIVFSTDANTLAQATGFTWNTSGAAGEGLAIAAGTATTAVNAFSLSQTWNASGTIFPGTQLLYTQTANNILSSVFAIFGGAAAATTRWFQRGDGAIDIGTTSIFSIVSGPFNGDFSMGGGSVQNTTTLANLQLAHNFLSDSNNNKFVLRTAGVFAWSSTTAPTGTVDTGLSRISAGLTGVGSGAQGSFAGRMKLTSTITAAVAVGSLNASPTIGEVQTVNDALAVTAKGATVANGGTAVCQVMWNGSNWVGI